MLRAHFSRFSVWLSWLLGLASCGGGCEKSGDASRDAAAALELPVPAPDELLAEAVVLDPNTSWGRVQRGTGGALALMPMNLGGLVTSLASLDPALGPEVDGASPAFGAIATGEPAKQGQPGGAALDVSYTFAVHLLDERRTRGTLLEGPSARYLGREAFGMTVLAPAPPKGGAAPAPALPMAVAISHGGYLVAARNESDLGRLGPYVARTLPSRPRPETGITLDVPRAALAGPIGPYLSSLWSSFRAEAEQKDARMREAHGGRAPDFADPRAIVEMADAFVKDELGIVGDLDRAHVGIDTSEEGLRMTASFVPAQGDGPATQTVRAMRVGSAEPLLDVPKTAPLALLVRSDAEARKASAHDASEAVAKALGDRIDAEGREKLAQALADWSKGRGDFLTMSWLDAPVHGLYVRAPAADRESASRAMRALVGLADKPAFKGPLETFLQVHQIAISQTEVAGVGKVELATMTRVAPAKTGASAAGTSAAAKVVLPSKGGIAWVTRPGLGAASGGSEIDVAIAEDAVGLLRDASAGDVQDSESAAAVKRLGPNVADALLMRRAALEPSRAGLGVMASWGREGNEARAYVEASHATVREWIRRAGGF